MPGVYNLLTADASPLTLTDVKSYVVAGDDEDTLLQALIEAATTWGEAHTRRSFRAQSWELLLDGFDSPIELRRQPVDAITSVEHYVNGALTAVDSAIYYLVQTAQGAEIYEADGQEWPDNTDDRVQSVRVVFTVAPWTRHEALLLEALRRHVAALYTNRGDCSEGSVTAAAAQSGAAALYSMMAVARV